MASNLRHSLFDTYIFKPDSHAHTIIIFVVIAFLKIQKKFIFSHKLSDCCHAMSIIL